MNIAQIVSCFIVFLLSLTIRFAAQAQVSAWFGDETSRRSGRGTLNVMAHVDPIGSILLPLGLLILSGGSSILGWGKPLEINPLYWRNRKMAQIVVSAAGPASHFLLAALAFVGLKLMLANGSVHPVPIADGSLIHLGLDLVAPASGESPLLGFLIKQFNILLLLNLVLGVFDLLPIPPLSGSFILECLLPDRIADLYVRLQPYGFILIIVLVMSGGFRLILSPLFEAVRRLLSG